jgi:hypothetical protein
LRGSQHRSCRSVSASYCSSDYTGIGSVMRVRPGTVAATLNAARVAVKESLELTATLEPAGARRRRASALASAGISVR